MAKIGKKRHLRARHPSPATDLTVATTVLQTVHPHQLKSSLLEKRGGERKPSGDKMLINPPDHTVYLTRWHLLDQ